MGHFRWLLLGLSLALARAQEPAAKLQNSQLQVAFINLRLVMASAPQYSQIQETLDREFKDEKKALVDGQAEISNLERQLFALSGSADSEQLRRTVAERRRELSANDAKYRSRFNIRRNEEVIKLQKLVMGEIVQLAKDRGYDVILNDSGVLYVDERADLTQELIQRLEQQKDKGNNHGQNTNTTTASPTPTG